MSGISMSAGLLNKKIYLCMPTNFNNHGFKKHELSLIEGIIEENVPVIIDRWKEYFKK